MGKVSMKIRIRVFYEQVKQSTHSEPGNAEAQLSYTPEMPSWCMALPVSKLRESARNL